VIRIELLPASFGDCILVEYGSGDLVRRILIDAGLKGTYKDALRPRLAAIGAPVALELLVVTHIDRDHICGILPLLEASPAIVAPEDVWFNGREHLEDDALGVKEAEALAKLLRKKRLPWNEAFEGRAVVVPAQGKLPTRKLPGGASLTLLSPYREELAALAECWEDDGLGAWDEEPSEETAPPDERDDTLGRKPAALRGIDVDLVRDLADAHFDEDDTAPNGSSIAFLFEFEEKRILFAGDAHPTPILRSLDRLEAGKVELDAFKLSHHGSKNNLSPALLDKVRCAHYLVSTNGGTYGHPHPEAMARIITSSRSKKTLHFNYACDYTSVWDDERTRDTLHYDVTYPPEGAVFEIET